MDPLAQDAEESTESGTQAGSPQEVLDRCFHLEPGDRAALARGKIPSKLWRGMDWVTGLPRFRWETALGLIGIGAGPQILWLQSGEASLLTWLSPLPALGTLGWWILRRRKYARLSRERLGDSMLSTVSGQARTSTRWSTDSSGRAVAHQTLHLAGEAFPLPSSLGERTIEGQVRVQILSLVSLSDPAAPPTRWVVAIELLGPI